MIDHDHDHDHDHDSGQHRRPYDIVCMAGDGIGPEIMREALRVLAAVETRFEIRFEFSHELVGGAAIDRTGAALEAETLARAKSADAVLFGAVGDPRFDDPSASARPEQAILALRRGLALFANLRPVRPHPSLLSASPLRPGRIANVDLLIVRELTGGIYFGARERGGELEERHARDTMAYSAPEVRRLVQLGFELAADRRGMVTSVDKSNVLGCSRLWREITTEVHARHPGIQLQHALVDSFAMHLITRPAAYDVVVTGNMFGDILSDEASVLTGSLGLMPSASLGAARGDGTRPGLYEPIHGSAPDIAGLGVANPIGMIASTALMLRHSLGLRTAAAAIESAIDRTLTSGLGTPDICPSAKAVGTQDVGRAVAEAVLAG